MNSEWVLRIEFENYRLQPPVYLRPAIDEPDPGCSIVWSSQVFTQGPGRSKKTGGQGIYDESFRSVAQQRGAKEVYICPVVS